MLLFPVGLVGVVGDSYLVGALHAEGVVGWVALFVWATLIGALFMGMEEGGGGRVALWAWAAAVFAPGCVFMLVG